MVVCGGGAMVERPVAVKRLKKLDAWIVPTPFINY